MFGVADVTQHIMQNHTGEVISTSSPHLCVFQLHPFSLQRPVFLGNPVQTVAVKIYSYTKSGKAQAARVRKSVKSDAMSRVEKRKIGPFVEPTYEKEGLITMASVLPLCQYRARCCFSG